jgi:hypothetical protein
MTQGEAARAPHRETINLRTRSLADTKARGRDDLADPRISLALARSSCGRQSPTHFDKKCNRGNIEDEADAVGIGHIGYKPLLPTLPESAQGLRKSGNVRFHGVATALAHFIATFSRL